MSLIGDILGAAVGGMARMLRLKRVKTSPLLDGPVHTYPSEMTRAVTFYELHFCTKCGLFNANRAAYTSPPCKGAVELP
jgi:hypothetical protein